MDVVDIARKEKASNLAESSVEIPLRKHSVPSGLLFSSVLLLFGLDHLLLIRFLGLGTPVFYLGYGAAIAALTAVMSGAIKGRVPLGRLLICYGVAGLVLLLGGEGRLFYSNVDWQVRYTLLSDMTRYPWPYAYLGMNPPKILRAPLGMYLLPAVAGKWLGPKSTDPALFLQNMIVLGNLMAMGSLLFRTTRTRQIVLTVLLLFSGMDACAALIFRPDVLWPFDIHIEGILGPQYSSILTLAFWVPQHAISGWIGALFYMLWRRDLVSLGTFLAIIPFCMLWSPLGVMGTVPFALLAFVQAMAARSVRWPDLILPACATVLVIPVLIYLGADAGKVGMHLASMSPLIYMLLELTEVVPILTCVVMLDGRSSFGRAPLWLIAACLLLFPFVMVGENVDFVMRASIPALLILAVIAAERLAESRTQPPRRWLLVVLAIGAITPSRELYRAVIYKPAPPGNCNLAGYWHESVNTYLARPSALPNPMQPKSLIFVPPRGGACYSQSWKSPRWSFVPEPTMRPGLVQ